MGVSQLCPQRRQFSAPTLLIPVPRKPNWAKRQKNDDLWFIVQKRITVTRTEPVGAEVNLILLL